MTQIQKPLLENLQIELTNSCNERCIHCYLPNQLKNTNQSLSPEVVISLLHQFHDMGGQKVVFSGGELLLYKELFKILEVCRELNLRILLQSNLLTLTYEMVTKFKQLDIFNIQVSLYSTDEQIHDSITQRKGSWRTTKKNLEMLVNNGIHVLISCPVMKQNFGTVGDLYQYADTLGVDLYFDYVMMAQCNGGKENLDTRLSKDQMQQMIDFMINTKPEYVDAIAHAKSLEDLLSKKFARRKTVCSILSSGFCIDTDGSAYPCPGWNGMKLGNIMSSSLSDIWYNSQKTLQLRNVTEVDFKTCTNCDLQNFCDMCAVYNYNENHDMFCVCKSFCDCAKMMKNSVILKYTSVHK